MEPSNDITDRLRSHLPIDQKSKLNMKIRSIEKEFHEKQKTLREYASRAKTLFTSKRKSAFELNGQENMFTEYQNQTEIGGSTKEFGTNGLKYSRLKKLLPKSRRRSYDFNTFLQANKQELAQIEQEIEKIEDDLQNNHILTNVKKEIPETLRIELQELSKQHEEDLRNLELHYQQSIKNQPLSLENSSKILKANNITKHCLRLKTYIPSTKWRGKMKTFVQELSNGVQSNFHDPKSEIETSDLADSKFVRLEDREIELKISDDEININPETITLHQQDGRSISSSENDSNIQSRSLPNFETISIRSNPSSSSNKEMKMSELFSLLVNRSKAFLKFGCKQNEDTSIRDLAESETASERESGEAHTSFEVSNETTSEVEENELDFMAHLAKTSRLLLGGKPATQELFQRTSSQNDLICPQPSTSTKMVLNGSESPKEDNKKIDLFSQLSQTTRRLRQRKSIKKQTVPKEANNFRNILEISENRSEGEFLTHLSNTSKRLFSKYLDKLHKKIQTRNKLPSKEQNALTRYVSKFTRSGTMFRRFKYGSDSLDRCAEEEIEMKELNLKCETQQIVGEELQKVAEGIAQSLDEELSGDEGVGQKSLKNKFEEELQTSVNVFEKKLSSQINGFKQSFSLNKLSEKNSKISQLSLKERQKETKNKISTGYSITRIKKMFSRTGNLSRENNITTKDYEIDKHRSAGDILDDLIDILHDIRESCIEAKEKREGLKFHNTKSEYLIKPMKVHRDYRTPTDRKTARKRTHLKEKAKVDENSEDHINTIETIAIVHKSLNCDPD